MAQAALMLESPVAIQMIPLEVAVPTLLEPVAVPTANGPETSVNRAPPAPAKVPVGPTQPVERNIRDATEVNAMSFFMFVFMVSLLLFVCL